MDRLHDHHQQYSWHQSHDQATVLVLLPYETMEDDVAVIFERNHLVAGIKGRSPVIKGRLYGTIDTNNSAWQLEPRPGRLSARERTTSTTSTASTQSSYAHVSDPEISSSFAASLEAGLVSDFDDYVLSSPALSSPVSSTMDDHLAFGNDARGRPSHFTPPPPTAPRLTPFAHTPSSFSSMESLHSGSGRLLTIHLEKADSIIWPSLVAGPAPESMSPIPEGVYPWAWSSVNSPEWKYNMDPTSMLLIGLELHDIRKDKEEAFEYFIRAWHQDRLPSAAIRLATHYLPLQTAVPDPPTDTSPPAEPPTPTFPTAPALHLTLTPHAPPPPPLAPGTPAYHLDRIGGAPGLAQLFLAAGLLHLEGAATPLLASSYSGLHALRTPRASVATTTTDSWRRDRDAAAQFFARARALCPALDVPLLPAETDSHSRSGSRPAGEREKPPVADSGELHMPTIDVAEKQPAVRRRREREREKARRYEEDMESSMVSSVRGDHGAGEDDSTWYLYIPGLVGAGTALLVVGFLSLSSWRKNQG